MAEAFVFTGPFRLPRGEALDVAELSVGRGERLVIFGPNGAGKTTLLRHLAGTLTGAPVDPGIAYLPQRAHAFKGSARRNLLLGLAKDRHGAAEHLAAELRVSGLLERAAVSLSGGERQRVALARALAGTEPLVLLDEPLAAIDLRDRDTVAAAIVRALEGRSGVIVTHDEATAAAVGDRIAVIVDGSIRQVGPVADVFSLPADEEVAAVVGLRNVLEGDVVAAGDGLVAVACGSVEVWALGELDPGDPARVLFGGETVTVSPPAPMTSSARNRWTGRVLTVRRVGRLVEVIVDVGVPVAAVITPGSFEALGLGEGSEVAVSFKATAARAVAVGIHH